MMYIPFFDVNRPSGDVEQFRLSLCQMVVVL